MHSEIFVTPLYTYVRKRIVGTNVIIQCPDWANWLAFDVDGYTESAKPFFFEDKPIVEEFGEQGSTSHHISTTRDMNYRYLEADTFVYLPYCDIDWSTILQPLELEEL